MTRGNPPRPFTPHPSSHLLPYPPIGLMKGLRPNHLLNHPLHFQGKNPQWVCAPHPPLNP